MPSSRESSQSKDRTCVSHVSCFGWWVLYHQHHLTLTKEAEQVNISGSWAQIDLSISKVLQEAERTRYTGNPLEEKNGCHHI